MAIERSTFPLPDVEDERTAGFFAGAAAGELRVPRCADCGRFVWYPADACPNCGGTDHAWVATSGRGTLFSWAIVRRAFLPAFEDLVPFVTAVVALDDDPSVRIVARLADVDPDADALTAGRAVHAVFRPLRFATVPDRAVTVPWFVLDA